MRTTRRPRDDKWFGHRRIAEMMKRRGICFYDDRVVLYYSDGTSEEGQLVGMGGDVGVNFQMDDGKTKDIPFKSIRDVQKVAKKA